ncbi:hypothetical protein L2E82_16348 [Cichorium intybus]|uniref:Uncharacterized protein n=1 Tax=Cichorium intybus TaxID=13427 RepID=A0ACB9F5Y1_CICIN|nr:hypothetical protein L2E82_16348 [Cichorium intybus]
MEPWLHQIYLQIFFFLESLCVLLAFLLKDEPVSLINGDIGKIWGKPVSLINGDIGKIWGKPVSLINGDIGKIWGKPVSLINGDIGSINKAVKRIGILTSEFPWINETIKIKVHGNCYSIKVVEDSNRSYNMAPKITVLDSDQSSDEDWFDMENDRGDKVEVEVIEKTKHGFVVPEDYERHCIDTQKACSEESRIENKRIKEKGSVEVEEVAYNENESKKDEFLDGIDTVDGHTLFGPCKDKPISPKVDRCKRKGGPDKPDGLEPEAKVQDLNESPIASGFYPFVENVDFDEDEIQLCDEDIIEQAISDKIEKKRRNRRKRDGNTRNLPQSQTDGSIESTSRMESKSGNSEEINQTLKFGEKLGINFRGDVELVKRAVAMEGGFATRC